MHQHVDPAVRLDHLLDHRRRLGEVGDGAEVGRGRAAGLDDLLDDVRGRALVAALPREARAEIVDDDLGAGLRERDGDAAPDAPAGARDQRRLAVEESHAHSGSGR